MRVFRLCVLLSCVALLAVAATLEKLSVEQMAEKSTLIVRGRITKCAGEIRGSVIYTRCGVAVAERWKGGSASQVDFLVPGGTASGLTQTFTGTPKFFPGEEYVLFLWSGRSGQNQVIGLSQGVFDVSFDTTGRAVVKREASKEQMFDERGNPVTDNAIEMRASELRTTVRQALAEGSRQE